MPTLGKHLISTLALAALLGCEAGPEPTIDLSLACQLTKCICKGTSHSLFEVPTEAPVLWTDRGAAFCPEGQVLERAEE